MLGVLCSIGKKEKVEEVWAKAGQEVNVNRGDQEGLLKRIIFWQKCEVSEKVSHAVSSLGEELSRQKEKSLQRLLERFLRNMKDASVLRSEWTRRIIKAELRETKGREAIIYNMSHWCSNFSVDTSHEKAGSWHRFLRATPRDCHPEDLQWGLGLWILTRTTTQHWGF